MRAADETPNYFIIEIATYPEARIPDQMLRDVMLVMLDRRVLPEVVTVVLRPKGRLRVSGTHKHASREGWTHLQLRWRVIEMWKVRASDILAANDVGAIPWVPLTNFEETPEAILATCRAKIEQLASPDQRANFLAVTQVMTHLRYNHQSQLLAILGGSKVMARFPLIQEMMDQAKQEGLQQGVHEARRQDLHRFLAARFGPVPADIGALLETIADDERLEALIDWSAVCPDLNAFRARLMKNGK